MIVLADGYWDGDNWVDLPYAVDFEINPSEWEEIFYNEETETEILKAIPINDSHFPAEYGGMKS